MIEIDKRMVKYNEEQWMMVNIDDEEELNRMMNDSGDDWLIDRDELNCEYWWLQKR